ncbi:hypothetical protein [Rhizobium sp. No.120]
MVGLDPTSKPPQRREQFGGIEPVAIIDIDCRQHHFTEPVDDIGGRHRDHPLARFAGVNGPIEPSPNEKVGQILAILKNLPEKSSYIHGGVRRYVSAAVIVQMLAHYRGTYPHLMMLLTAERRARTAGDSEE